MSLVVAHAHRFPLSAQQQVHDRVYANVAKITAALVEGYVSELCAKIGNATPDLWYGVLSRELYPHKPDDLGSRRIDMYRGRDTPELFTRAYLYEWNRWADVYVSEWRMFDTALSWSYIWDSTHGYLTLYSVLGVDPADMTAGLDGVIEPFSYDGRVMETDSVTVPADEVKRTWDRLLDDPRGGSMAAAGAAASLSQFDLLKAYRLC